jgi:hypothetical protein
MVNFLISFVFSQKRQYLKNHNIGPRKVFVKVRLHEHCFSCCAMPATKLAPILCIFVEWRCATQSNKILLFLYTGLKKLPTLPCGASA